MSLRPSPVVNHVSKMNCDYVLQAGEPSLYKLVGLCVIRPGSLSVEGQEPDFCTCNYAQY